MNWNDIHDPTGKVEIIGSFAGFAPHYTPEVMQALINEHGMSGMVSIVNEHMAMKGSPYVLTLVKQDERTMLIESLNLPSSNL